MKKFPQGIMSCEKASNSPGQCPVALTSRQAPKNSSRAFLRYSWHYCTSTTTVNSHLVIRYMWKS